MNQTRYIYISEVVDDDDIAENIYWEMSKQKDMDTTQTGIKLTPTEAKAFAALMKKFKDVFAYDLTRLGTCNLGSKSEYRM